MVTVFRVPEGLPGRETVQGGVEVEPGPQVKSPGSQPSLTGGDPGSSRTPGFKPQLCHSLLVWLWANCLTSVMLVFPFLK